MNKVVVRSVPTFATVVFLRLSKDRDEAESIDVQRANALAFARRQGWQGETVEIADSGESGAEIHKRPGIQRLLKLAAERSGRIRVVMRDIDRFSRAGIMWTGWLLCELELKGVDVARDVWDYGTGLQVPVRGPEALMTAVHALRAEGEWDSNSKRRREALRFRAQEGRATRTAPWGYLREGDGKNKRWRADERVVPTIIRVGETFVAAGGSLRTTAAHLNVEGVASPGRVQEGGTRAPGKWTAKSVAHVLRTPYYRGQLVHGATRRIRQGGSVVTVAAAEGELLRVPRPDLKIWPDDLLARIDELLARIKPSTHRFGGGAAHLGSSFLMCGLCGGAMSVTGSTRGGKSYVCTAASGTGKTACTGCGYKAEARVDAALLAAVAPLVGDGEIAKLAMAKLRERVDAITRADGRDVERERLRKAIADSERRQKNLTRALAAEDGDQADLLAERRAERERAGKLAAELEALDAEEPTKLSDRRLLDRAAEKLAELAALRDVGGLAARPALLSLLGDRRFTVIPVLVDGKRTWTLRAEVPTGYLGALVGVPGALGSVPSSFAAVPSCASRRAWPWPARRPRSVAPRSGARASSSA
jgi:hypothetical protein